MKKAVKSKPKAKPKAKPKIQGKPKAKATPKKNVSLEAIVAEIERISLRLDSIEKDIRNLKGIAYPMS